MVSTETKASLIRWASDKPCIVRMWIFGSRVRGDNRADSDLGMAFELQGNARFDADGIFIQNQFPWSDELSTLTGYYVHVVFWRLDNKVPKGPPGSILLYPVAEDVS